MANMKAVLANGQTYHIPQRPLTVQEVAEILQVQASVVRDRLSHGRLTALPKEEWPNGKCALVTPASVEEYLRTRRTVRRWHGPAVAAV